MTEGIDDDNGLKQSATETLPALVDMIELRLVAEALAGAEGVRPDRISAVIQAPLRNETLATLGATAGEHLATILGGHAGSEAVGAIASHFAGLVGTFHFKRVARKRRQGYAGGLRLSRKMLALQ